MHVHPDQCVLMQVPNICSELLVMVLDMTCVLLHSTLVSGENMEKGEENRKLYGTIMKKLKREVLYLLP